jgi:glucose-6-phosphate 1-dehydrogenase
MATRADGAAPSDALVLFGVTGDLAHKMIFSALYVMAKRKVLNAPVIGVASPPWSLARLRKRAADGIRKAGPVDDSRALRHLTGYDLSLEDIKQFRQRADAHRR